MKLINNQEKVKCARCGKYFLEHECGTPYSPSEILCYECYQNEEESRALKELETQMGYYD